MSLGAGLAVILSGERHDAPRLKERNGCMTVARYAGSMNDRPIPPAEAGGYFLKPATRARPAAVRRLQEIDPVFSRGWSVPPQRARVSGRQIREFLGSGSR